MLWWENDLDLCTKTTCFIRSWIYNFLQFLGMGIAEKRKQVLIKVWGSSLIWKLPGIHPPSIILSLTIAHKLCVCVSYA